MSDDKIKAVGAESIAFENAHSQACQAQLDFYIDPVTGYQVMTSYFLKNRGYCCKNNCRHCPYDSSDQTKKDL